MGKSKGWIKLDRNLLDQPFWNDKPFSKGHAWVDLLLTAHWLDGVDRVGNRKRKARPGQLWFTYQGLADRWGWSKSAVNRFLHELVETDRATLDGTAYGTRLTLKNWDKYQYGETHSETLSETQCGKPTYNIRKEEREDKPFVGEDPDEALDDDGLTCEELYEYLRV